jgi:acetamidase/formamidase
MQKSAKNLFKTSFSKEGSANISSSFHRLAQEHAHLAWDHSIPPVLRIASGAVVHLSCLDASNGQITPASTCADLAGLDFARLDQLNGPIFVEGAQPGDVLQIEVLEVRPSAWGWTAIIPGFGLLADEFPEPALKIWQLDVAQGFAWFDQAKGIR